MKKTIMLLMLATLLAYGCAYRHYLGLHGPSIKAYPEVHRNASTDEQCLSCHHSEKKPRGPETSHPGFKGCFKCHND